MRASFTRNEMISATAAAKNFGKVVADLVEQKKEKTAVVKNNEITAVILPVAEYEYMAEVVELVEHFEIHNLIATRQKNLGRLIPLDELLKEEGLAV